MRCRRVDVAASMLGIVPMLLCGSAAAQSPEPADETVESEAATPEEAQPAPEEAAVEAPGDAEDAPAEPEPAGEAEPEPAPVADAEPQPQLAPPAVAAPTAEATPTPAPPSKSQKYDPKRFPRLVLAVHGTLGPHSSGEETCRAQGSAVVCDRTGRFLGAGGSLGLRVRLYEFFYGHVRFIALGNAFGTGPEDLHDGLLAPAAGVDLMSGLALLRIEFAAPFALGGDRYRAPGHQTTLATETWGHAAGSLAIGARLPFHERVRGELTAGVWVGPGYDRVTPSEEGDKKGPLISFQIGLGTAFDLVGDNR